MAGNLIISFLIILFKTKFILSSLEQIENEFQTISPAASSECFDLYLPQLQAAADQWSINYNNCISTAKEERNAFFTQINNDQTDIITNSNAVCEYIKNCQAITNSTEFMDCFSKLSENALDIVYLISNEASDDLRLLTEQPDNIDDSLYLCSNDSQRTYIEQTAKVYEDLDNCLMYGLSGTTDETTESISIYEITTEEQFGETEETEETSQSTTDKTSTEIEYSTLPIMAV